MNDISILLQLEQNCRNCNSYEELLYLIVNETRGLIKYDQSLLLESTINNRFKTVAVSDIQVVDRTVPFIQLVESIAKHSFHTDKFKDVRYIKHDDIDHKELSKLREYSPPHILYIPIKFKKNDVEVNYILLLFRQKPYINNEEAVAKHLSLSYAHFIFAWQKISLKELIQKSKLSSKHLWITFAVVFFTMLLPVHMSVLAPVQVEPKDPFIVTSPLNGAIKKIYVEPNEKVSNNFLLIDIEDSEFQSDYSVAERSYEVAQARLHTANQGSFFDVKQKSTLASLKTEMELKKAEVEFSKKQLQKTKIYSKKSGVVIINNPKEWEGKPVVIGERILQIADEKSIELTIMLPVKEAVFLEKGAKVKVFFDNDPLYSWDANVTHISYIPTQTPEQILSYKIVADFNELDLNTSIPSIGTRGMAKIYSNKVTLFFYLFRRPITALRQWIGW
jgi:hypothetical protein